MKVAILSYSGSVGKTVVASHLLAPRMPGASIFAVETINETADNLGLDVEQLRGAHFGRLFRELLLADAAIIDVGASNVEEFMAQMVKYDQAHAEFDYFVVPVIPTGKAMRETIATIQALAAVGVEPGRVRVLFNRVDGDVQDEFAAIFGYARQAGQFVANPEASILDSELFDLLGNQGTTIADVLADGTDYKQQLAEADRTDTALIARLSDLHVLQALARPVNRQLDKAFRALFA